MSKRKRSRLEIKTIKVAREEALIKQKGCCKYCYTPLTKQEATADHRIARSKGGSNLSFNIDAVCEPCNVAKDDMNPGIFLREIKNPSKDSPFLIWMSWSRRRTTLKMHRACRNIGRAAGVEINVPI